MYAFWRQLSVFQDSIPAYIYVSSGEPGNELLVQWVSPVCDNHIFCEFVLMDSMFRDMREVPKHHLDLSAMGAVQWKCGSIHIKAFLCGMLLCHIKGKAFKEQCYTTLHLFNFKVRHIKARQEDTASRIATGRIVTSIFSYSRSLFNSQQWLSEPYSHTF